MSSLLRVALVWLVRIVVGAHPRYLSALATGRQRIYFSNHTSHVDTMAILAALPARLRESVRPVAARDYWDSSPLRSFVARRVLDVVFVERQRQGTGDPLDPLREALREGASLVIFPEGTRGAGPEPGPFRSGIFRLSREFPDVELVPVSLSNLNRVMPKGKVIPVPLLCRVGFGAPLERVPGEEKDAFLERARGAVITIGKT
ncbi:MULTISPECIES: 1-acyl-sn-glycerol-3-phosphate acyltransferase [unclassified Microbispora]|uniref:lysophospholipid acyltransferase family protein n=1 Tax=unclassified Microbispora TaxID=2614687 RepID=UPI0014729536|nr:MULTISPECIES: lysophospholipid acyltransferase family protein [unclassified Microbispora]